VSTADILPYARLVLIKALDNQGWPEGFHRRSDLVESLKQKTIPKLQKFDPRIDEDTLDGLVDLLFDEMAKENAFPRSYDPFAGDYFTVGKDRIKLFRTNALNSNSIIAKANQIGFDSFFADVFAGFRVQQDSSARAVDGAPQVRNGERSMNQVRLIDEVQADLLPASDRLVPLNHNSAPYKEIASGLAKLHEELRGANDLDCSPEERERLVASMGAARQLWDAAQLKIIQIRVGIIIAIDDAINALTAVGRATGKSMLITLIKSFVKNATGIDL
jgi:hypothetical protein